jgi:hypothetical protein
MTTLACENIFRLSSDANLYGRSSHHIKAGFERKKVSDKRWIVKVKPVNGSCYGVAACMTGGSHTRRVIDMFHKNPTVNVSSYIGILRESHRERFQLHWHPEASGNVKW